MRKLNIGFTVGFGDGDLASANGNKQIFVSFAAVNEQLNAAGAKLHSLRLDGKKRINEPAVIEYIQLFNVAKRHSVADLCHVFASLRVKLRESERNAVFADNIHCAHDDSEHIRCVRSLDFKQTAGFMGNEIAFEQLALKSGVGNAAPVFDYVKIALFTSDGIKRQGFV